MKVEKEAITAVIHIERFRLEGKVHIHPRTRFSDFLNVQHQEFVLMTDVQVFREDTGERVEELPFVGVGRGAIHMIYPREMRTGKSR